MKYHYYDYTEKLSLVLQKARKGQAITIGFLGGSITQGCNPSVPENAYAVRTYNWLKEFLAPTEVRYINAGIGATGSLMGVHRMVEDLLQYKPDIIVVEFAANDVPPTDGSKKSYESVIRGIIEHLPNTAIIELMMTLQDGTSAYAQQTQIGHHYKVPMVSYRQEVLNGIAAGEYTWEEIETDEVHPNDRGHKIVADLLANLFEVADKNKVSEDYHYEMPKEVLFSKKYSDGIILNRNNYRPLYTGSFYPCDDGFKSLCVGWKAKQCENNKALVCKVVAKNIHLLYRKNVGEQMGIAEITIDYDKKLEVDSSFPNGWGDYAEVFMLLEEDACREHIIEIKLKEGKATDTFTVLGLLVSKA